MSSWWSQSRDEEDGDEENEDGDEDDLRSAEDQIIFLIDAGPHMFTTNGKGEMHIQNSLKLALSVMKTKIIASGKSTVGVIFFGAQKANAKATVGEGGGDDSSASSSSSDGCAKVHQLFSLDVPSATRMKALQTLSEDEDALKDLVGDPKTIASQTIPLKEALWSCSQAFNLKSSSQQRSRANDYKRVWIFTNEDSPNAHSIDEQQKTVQVARDCSETGIVISLWHMNKTSPSSSSKPFDTRAFYTRLLVADEEDEEALDNRILGAGLDGFDAMLSRARMKVHKKRKLATLKFIISASMTQHIAVQLYNVVMVAKRPQSVWLNSHSNEPLKIVSRKIDASTGEVLSEDDMRTYIDFVGEKIYLSKAEYDELKMASSVLSEQSSCLKLLYLVPRKALTRDMNISSSNFIVPDEGSVKGSALLFSAILSEMSSKGLVGIAVFRRTSASTPRLVALLPQTETEHADGSDASTSEPRPGGINLVPLPFLSEMRSALVSEMTIKAEEIVSSQGGDAIEAAEALIEKLKYDDSDEGDPFEFTDLESPSIQSFYSYLQAIALTEQSPEWSAERDDHLQPNRTKIQSVDHEGSEVSRLLSAIAAIAECGSAAGGASKGKRKAPATAKAPAATEKKKRGKAAAVVEDDDEDDDDVGDGGRKAKTANAAKKTTKAAAKKSGGRKAKVVDSSEDDDSESDTDEDGNDEKPAKRGSQTTGRGRGRGRGAGRGRG